MLRWLAIFCIFAAFLPGAAYATDDAADRLCTLPTGKDAGFEYVKQTSRPFNCGEGKFSAKSSRVWVRIDMTSSPHRSVPVELNSDGIRIDKATVVALFDDGRTIQHSYTSREIRDNMHPRGRTGIEVPFPLELENTLKLNTIYVAYDGLWSPTTLSLMEIHPVEGAEKYDTRVMLMFAAMLGMTVVPFVYNLFFYRALKYRFMLWHAIAIVMTAIYTLSSSGLLFFVFENATLWTRFVLNYSGLSLGVAAGCVFTLNYMEPGKLSASMKWMLVICSAFSVGVTIWVVFGGDATRVIGRNMYNASFLPVFAVNIAAMVQAYRNGSRAVKFQIAAWVPIFIFGTERIARGMDLYQGYPVFDYGLYFMLLLENIILALGVADRVMYLKRQHSKAVARESDLLRQVETDGLTGIGNRRGFEKKFAKDETSPSARFTHLAMLDIDWFKKVNDKYGHETGDDVLRVVGNKLGKSDHYTARIGGEEFALLIVHTNTQDMPVAQTTALCEQLIRAVSKEVPELQEPVTFSVGLARIHPDAGLKEIMAAADRRLYLAKSQGRNQVVGYDKPRASVEENLIEGAATAH